MTTDDTADDAGNKAADKAGGEAGDDAGGEAASVDYNGTSIMEPPPACTRTLSQTPVSSVEPLEDSS